MYTTLRKLSDINEDSLVNKILAGFNKQEIDNEAIDVLFIHKMAGLDSTIASIKSVSNYHKKKRLIAADIAEFVFPYLMEKYPDYTDLKSCIIAARSFACKAISYEELFEKRISARYASALLAGKGSAAAAANAIEYLTLKNSSNSLASTYEAAKYAILNAPISEINKQGELRKLEMLIVAHLL